MNNFKRVVIGILVLFLWGSIIVKADYLSEPSRFAHGDYAKKVSMDFKDAALGDILKIFSQQSGMNFIAATDVSNKKVTLFFEAISVEEALEKILTANGLFYELEEGSGVFIVKALPLPEQNLVTKFYQLKHASVPSSKIHSTISITDSSDEESSGSSGASSAGNTQSSGAGIVAAIQGVLTRFGKLTEDPRTNSLIVTDLASQFKVIDSTIARLDVAVPQILIEVEMLDVSKNTADLIGIKYGDSPLSVNGGTRQVLYPWNLHLLKDKGFAFEDPEYTTGLLDASGMSALVQFLKTQTDTRNLARPRLITLNNETAQIKIATDEAIGVSTQTTATGGGASDTTKEAERVETGVSLLVTPQANVRTGEITMAIIPRVIQARTGATFEGQSFKDPEERGSKQIMKVKNGETIVIGGLLRTDELETITKVPLLGDIPFIGRVFRHNDKTVTERELLIFITPSIIDEKNKSKLLKERKQPLSREQDIPESRLKQIDQELTTIERQKF